MKKKISIIVPIFNSGIYLDKCINSIINQTYSNLEIILIDDGSEDNSWDICKKYSDIDNRIRIIQTENRGQSSARNIGLEEVTGDYIGFVDSDDWIDPDMYESLMNLLVENKGDIAECGIRTVYDDKIIEEKGESFLILDRVTSIRNFLNFNKQHALIVIVNKLYNKEVLSNIKFPNVPAYEDDYFTLRALNNSSRLISTTKAMYNYYQTSSPSVIRGQFSRRRLAIIDVLSDNVKFLEGKVPIDVYEKAKVNYYGRLLYSFSMIHVNNLSGCDDYKNLIAEEIRNGIPEILSFKGNNDLKLKSILFRTSKKMYLFAYKTFNKVRFK